MTRDIDPLAIAIPNPIANAEELQTAHDDVRTFTPISSARRAWDPCYIAQIAREDRMPWDD